MTRGSMVCTAEVFHALLCSKHLYSSSSPSTIILRGPFFTMILITSYRASAAAMVVCSAFVSYAGYVLMSVADEDTLNFTR